MKTAFHDLENNDDASSINSSHYDSTRETNCTNAVVDSDTELGTPKDQITQLQNDFGIYDNAVIPNNVRTNHRLDTENDLELYRQMGTPYNNNNNSVSESNSAVLETPFELAKPPGGYIRRMHPQLVEERNENYTYNYGETPSNHYNTHLPFKYSNNGFTNTYENNVQNSNQIHGGGDTSDHMNHCYKTSPNGTPLNDEVAYKTAEYNSKEQLEVLHMVRLKEIDRLMEKIQQLQSEKEQMSRKLMLLESEVEGSNISRNQAQLALGKIARSESFDKSVYLKLYQIRILCVIFFFINIYL